MTDLIDWEDGAAPTVVGGVTVDGGVGYPAVPALLFEQVGGFTAVARWDITSTGEIAARGYVHTPPAWASSAVGFCFFLDTPSTQVAYAAFSGTGAPGQIRLYRSGGTSVAASANDTIDVDTTYRFELQLDTAATRARLALFPLESDTAIWESGWITHASYGTAVDRVEVGTRLTTPTIGEFWIDSLLVTDDTTDYIGRHADDDLPAPTDIIFEWKDGSAPTVLGGVTVDGGLGFPDTPALFIQQIVDQVAYARWEFTAEEQVGLRFYIKTPLSWGSAALTIAAMKIGTAASFARVVLGGTGQPGQIRLSRTGGTTVVASSQNTIQLDTIYRIELLLDSFTGMARAAIFPPKTTYPIWDSQWQAHTDFEQEPDRIEIGSPTATPQMNPFWIDTIKAKNVAEDWVGPDVDDSFVVTRITYWDGTTEITPLEVNVWDGALELTTVGYEVIV